ncbi:hypothetical protein Tco_0461932 [Tanacetum coccineum]
MDYQLCVAHRGHQSTLEDVSIVGDNCGFNGWFDPPMCPRAVVIIPGLLRNINELREIADANAIKARRMKFLLGFSWFFFVVYIMMK